MIATIFLFFAYQTLSAALFPLVIIVILFLHAKKNIIGNIWERIGLVPQTDKTKPVFWLHAVSVGEVLSIQELINHIKKTIPHAICYLTVGTISGKRIAKAHIKTDFISFLPYDFLPCVLMAYYRINPKALIIVEAELWPNVLALARFQRIPTYWLNARINPRSLKKLFFFKPFFRILISCFNRIFAQSQNDKQLFEQLGISRSKIDLLGNLKAFNVTTKKDSYLATLSYRPAPPEDMHILLAGSIHPKEDELYLALFQELKKTVPTLKLILAPRHFTWQATLIEHVKQTNLPFFVWQDRDNLPGLDDKNLDEALQKTLTDNDILLVCKLGELFSLYPYATIFFLGGTFIPVGGHNLLEPAAWGIPTIIGPFYANCNDIVTRLQACNGIMCAKSNDSLVGMTQELLLSNDLQNQLKCNSTAWVEQESEMVKITLRKLMHALEHASRL